MPSYPARISSSFGCALLGCPVSTGFVASCLTRLADKLDGFEADLKDALAGADRLYHDETPEPNEVPVERRLRGGGSRVLGRAGSGERGGGAGQHSDLVGRPGVGRQVGQVAPPGGGQVEHRVERLGRPVPAGQRAGVRGEQGAQRGRDAGVVPHCGVDGARGDVRGDHDRRDPRAEPGEVERGGVAVQQPVQQPGGQGLRVPGGDRAGRGNVVVQAAVLVVGD